MKKKANQADSEYDKPGEPEVDDKRDVCTAILSVVSKIPEVNPVMSM